MDYSSEDIGYTYQNRYNYKQYYSFCNYLREIPLRFNYCLSPQILESFQIDFRLLRHDYLHLLCLNLLLIVIIILMLFVLIFHDNLLFL